MDVDQLDVRTGVPKTLDKRKKPQLKRGEDPLKINLIYCISKINAKTCTQVHRGANIKTGFDTVYINPEKVFNSQPLPRKSNLENVFLGAFDPTVLQEETTKVQEYLNLFCLSLSTWIKGNNGQTSFHQMLLYA